MRYWEKFSRSTFNLAVKLTGRSLQTHSLETVLKNGIAVLDPVSVKQLGDFVLSRQTPEGGFMDRAGRSDLYYSVFGCFVAEALGLTAVNQQLKLWKTEEVQKKSLEGIYLNCAAILFAKLDSPEKIPSALREKVMFELQQPGNKPPIYSGFLGLMTYFYLKDLKGLVRLFRNLKKLDFNEKMPCPVTAAQTVLTTLTRRPTDHSTKELMSFYKGRGGFSALINAPQEDLLSTAVALYALRFAGSDIRLIIPDCFEYVDSLWENGGFHSIAADTELDIEYTFYGLLALGALNDNNFKS